MKFYVTKYALTKGIVEVDVDDPQDRHYIIVREWWHTTFRIGTEAFATREEASEAALMMAKKRLTGLHRQIARVSGLALSPKWAKVKR